MWLRVVMGLFVVQLLTAQLWPTLHHALFAHAVCAEHGELVHLSAHEHEAADSDHAASAEVTPGAADDEHDHCQLPPGTHDPASEPGTARASGVVHVCDAAAFAPCDAGLARSIPILALAPKQSPPA